MRRKEKLAQQEGAKVVANPNPVKPLLISFVRLRQAIGAIGLCLPFALALGGFVLFGRGLEPSMSAYYHTPMRDFFVGALCAIGVFLSCYNGYDWMDRVASAVAGVTALSVALFPTDGEGGATWVGGIHSGSAAVLFLTLSWMSLVQFTKSTSGALPTANKGRRNAIYRLCGSVMVICVLAVAILSRVMSPTAIADTSCVFWAELVALCAFGVSWSVKGEVILKD